MPYQLPGFTSRRRKAHTIDHAVQTALQQDEQVLAGHTFHTVGFVEVVAELLFKQTVCPLDALLLAQLGTVVRNLDTALAVLSYNFV